MDKKTAGLSIRAPEAVRAAIRHGAAIRGISQSDFMIDACRKLLGSMNGEILLPHDFAEIPVDSPGMMTIRLPPDMLESIQSTAPRAYQKATQFVLWASMRAFYETPDKARDAIALAVKVSQKDRADFFEEACVDLLENLGEAVLEDFDDTLLEAVEEDDLKLSSPVSRRISKAWATAWEQKMEQAADMLQAASLAAKKGTKEQKKRKAAEVKRCAAMAESVRARTEARNKTREKRCFILQAAMRTYFELREKYA